MKIEMYRKQEVELLGYWVLRGIKDTGTKKEVVAEELFVTEPQAVDIAAFLVDHPEADFCSVEHNYRIVKGE